MLALASESLNAKEILMQGTQTVGSPVFLTCSIFEDKGREYLLLKKTSEDPAAIKSSSFYVDIV